MRKVEKTKAPEEQAITPEEQVTNPEEQVANPEEEKQQNAQTPKTDNDGTEEGNGDKGDGVGKNKAEQPVITDFVDEILQLHPQYKKLYVSSKGFVYPEGTPEYQRKNAVLYENKYYNNKKQ